MFDKNFKYSINERTQKDDILLLRTDRKGVQTGISTVVSSYVILITLSFTYPVNTFHWKHLGNSYAAQGSPVGGDVPTTDRAVSPTAANATMFEDV